MFVKCKPNKSGSVSVQLMEAVRHIGKKNPTSRLIKSFGSSKNPQEIEELKAQAKEYLDQFTQHRGSVCAQALLIQSSYDVDSCRSYVVGFKQVFGSVYENVFGHLTGLKHKGNQMLQDLAIMRIACPKSKRFTANISDSFGINLNTDSIYKLMDRIDDSCIEKVKSLAFANTKRLLCGRDDALDVLFYDLTTLAFETNTRDGLREFGFSKDGKHHHVQIMMALLVTKSGLPVGYELFQGNTYEGHTMIPFLGNLKEKYAIKDVVVVADRGLMSQENIKGLKNMGFKYILGGRLKSGSSSLKKEALDLDSYQDLGEDLQGKIASLSSPQKKEGQIQKDSVFIYKSQKRARKDAHERDKHLAKIESLTTSSHKKTLSKRLQAPYVKVDGDHKISIDPEKVKEDARFDGIFSIETNLENASLQEIYSFYQGLWQVEQTFRVAKYNLKMRPVFHYNQDRIKAHFLICYIALVLVRTLEFQMREHLCYLPLEQLCEMLKLVRIVKLRIQEKDYTLSENFPPQLLPIYKSIKLKPLQKFSSS